MRVLSSLLFNAAFILWTAAVCISGLPAFFSDSYKPVYGLGQRWGTGTIRLLRWLCGLRYELRGLERLPDGPVILACKHQSTWDTLVIPRLVPGRYPAYVLKIELTRLPLFGPLLRKGGMIAVDRSAGGKALKDMLAQARERVADGRSLVIYPEGTRTAPGKKLPYHPGVAALYKDLGLPVVPVALNSGFFWGRRAWLIRPGQILLEVLEPIEPGLDRRDFLQRLEAAVEGASGRLLKEAEEAASKP
ncbi:lysophospholipid acyltransferase family protein [Limibacillus halophilus]